jgi:hypothetical protein
MEEKKKNKVTSEILEDVVKEAKNDRITIRELTLAMKTSGFGVIMFLFSLPIVIPVPPPVPSIVSIPLLFFSSQMMIGTTGIWIPKWLGNLSVKRSTLAIIFEKSFPVIRRFEQVVKTRLYFMSSTIGERVIGLLSLLFSFSILLPIPFSNLLPGLAIMIMSFGLIGKDGLIVIIGMIVGALGISLTTAVLFLGKEAISIIFSFLH